MNAKIADPVISFKRASGPKPTMQDLYSLADLLGEGHHKLAVAFAGRFMPYGMYVDGRTQTLFDRSYNGLWQKRADGRIVVAPNAWIGHDLQLHFFKGEIAANDYTGMKRLRAVLVDWDMIGRGWYRRRA